MTMSWIVDTVNVAVSYFFPHCSYITSDDVVELKGKVACEISSANELTLSELMFNGVFKDIKVEEIVSLLSCFVWQEKLQDAAKPREELELLFIQLQDTARRVAKVQLECKVSTNFYLPKFIYSTLFILLSMFFFFKKKKTLYVVKLRWQ